MARESTQARGNRGEAIALRFLRAEKLTIIETQYRYGRGEIDIIAREGDVLVFCEVKMRTSDRYGAPEYAVTPRKQAQIRRIAEAYLYEHEIRDQICRFDVVAIDGKSGRIEIRYLRNAFQGMN